MKLLSVAGNSQRLDGGAMFGNVPKALWQRWMTPDEDNRIPLSCRAMLVQDQGQNLLFETGIGAFFEPRLKERFGVVEEGHVLLDSLEAVGVDQAQIDVVVLSHLHFDHAGGLLSAWNPHGKPELLFPNARFVVSEPAFERARHPHPRDRASFIEVLPELLVASGRLELISQRDVAAGVTPFGEGYRFHLSDGHTPGLMLTEVPLPSGPVLFAGDLVPGVAWVHLPVTMGYDRFPERLIEEKRVLFEDLAARGGRLFYTHDHEVAASAIEQDERGRWRAADLKAAPVTLS